MHVPDGVLSTPVCAVTAAVSFGAVHLCLVRLRSCLADRIVPLAGMMSALIFAAQMVNFPLIGVPVSGHLLGGVLAAVILGPWAGCLSLTLVLIVQATLFSDGGMLALGVNVLHMAVVGSIGGYVVYATIRRLRGSRPVDMILGAVVASWVSVMAASALFCLEFWLSWHGTDRHYDFTNIFTLMVSVHSAIGIGEALITGAVIAFIIAHRPDLIYSPEPTSSLQSGLGGVFATGLIAALAVAAFLAPFASEYPDGLEAVAVRKGFGDAGHTWSLAPLAGYDVPVPHGWQAISVSLAGILGTAAVAVIALVFGRVLKSHSSTTIRHVE